jgi:small subunit ribosomal protein S8
MVITSTLANFFSDLQNHARLLRPSMVHPVSKQIPPIAEILLEIGVIAGYKITDDKEIVIFLKSRDGRPVLKDLKMVSRPGRKAYITYLALTRRLKLDTLILSTTSGFMTDTVAKKKGMGGKIICSLK